MIKDLFGILVIVNVNMIKVDSSAYLEYENCKCRKKLVDKLIDECTETIEEVKSAKITLIELHFAENENKYSFLQSIYCIDDSSFYNFCWNSNLFCLLQLVFD